MNGWQNLLSRAINKEISLGKWAVTNDAINRTLFGVENITVIYVAALAAMAGQISVGMIFAFISFKTRFTSAITSLADQIVNFRMVGLHLERLSDVAFAPEDTVADADVGVGRGDLTGELSVQALSYRYGEASEPVFQGLGFVIHAGETVAIIGPSGCGKTTLVKLMMGLLVPLEGRVVADGVPVSRHSEYRAGIAAVMQEDQLLAGSIIQNITCFSQNIDFELVKSVVKMANIEEEIDRLPMRYNTLVGDSGVGLSGGQQQRIMIARALYQEPKFLFLDEATSNLDVESEKQVSDSLSTLSMTRVIVAHRPQTIASADRVIDLGQHRLER